MRRADRLFRIVQYLRGRRLTTAAWLAGRLDVAPRTIYRDIKDLILSGLPIEGEAGVGYVLRRKLDLPPLEFDRSELAALLVGLRFSMGSLPPAYARAASTALAKVRSVLPDGLAEEAERMPIFVPVRKELDAAHFELLDRAIRGREKLDLAYADERGRSSRRRVHPLALFYLGRVWTFVAWDELRSDFRSFRLDRVRGLEETGERFPAAPGRTLEDFFGKMRKEHRLSPADFDPEAG